MHVKQIPARCSFPHGSAVSVVDRVIPTANHQIKLQGTRNSRAIMLNSVKNFREAYHIIASGDLWQCRVELQPAL
jgi:hypothetical protein